MQEIKFPQLPNLSELRFGWTHTYIFMIIRQALNVINIATFSLNRLQVCAQHCTFCAHISLTKLDVFDYSLIQ